MAAPRQCRGAVSVAAPRQCRGAVSVAPRRDSVAGAVSVAAPADSVEELSQWRRPDSVEELSGGTSRQCSGAVRHQGNSMWT